MPKTPTTPSKDFSETLDELIAFKEYFTNDDKNKVLAQWIHEETGINKASVRLALKYVAPFVIARLAQAGEIVGKAWMAKLHDKMSEKEWYFNFTQNILNTLKTKTDNALGEAFTIASDEHLAVLITDKARWENLKPEQQGLVQLLLGQNQQTEAQDGLRRQLDNIVEQLSFNLDLQTPEFLITDTENALNQQAQKSSPLWLTFKSRQAKLIGRDNSLKLLNEFFDTDKNFSWLVITGEGGTGKSRLALDALLSRQTYCDVGFLHSDKLGKSDALDNWQPVRPTIITIDYAAEYPDEIANWIDHFIQHQSDYDFPVRLLILERVAKEQSWWKSLTSSSANAATRKSYLHTPEPHELHPLTRPEQQQALQSFLDSLDCEETLPDQDNHFWEVLDTLSSNGRPLFIGMVASAIKHHGIHQVRNWTQAELLKHVLDREEKRWQATLSQYSENEKASIYKLLTIATLCGGLDIEHNENHVYDVLNETDITNSESELERYIEIIKQLSGNPSGSLQPDIFAEYFLLQDSQYITGGFTRSLKNSLVTAQELSLQNTHAFISRTAVDYTTELTAFEWWKLLFTKANEEESNELLEELTASAFNTISQLSLHGERHTILDHWLPTLCALDDLKSKAKAINFQGLLNSYLGNKAIALEHYQTADEIYKKLGEKSGESSTLNNISQIFKARGDYETTLKYLQQSLAIQQEIGDKSGEGTTLNNMATTAHARGDYEIALKYLQQSMAIKQATGDKSGEGTTLNNMATTAYARGDYEIALKYLQQSLAIQQEVGNKSGEGTTFNNISLIYSASGDYETALKYLQQSLAIQQKIGDAAGFCLTKINIGHIEWQNKQPKGAYKSWANAYLIAKKIGHAQALEALTSMAEQLKLPDGVESWDKILDEEK